MKKAILQLPSGASVVRRPIEVTIYVGRVTSGVTVPAISSRRKAAASAAPVAKAA